MKLTDLAARNPQHLLVHGMPKSGKSTLLSQLAEAGFHLYWISLDNGHSVLNKLSATAKANIDIIVLPDTRDFAVAAVTCQKLFKMQTCKICDTHGQVDCSSCSRNKEASWTNWDFKALTANDIVVVDHISGLADSFMNYICKTDFEKNAQYKPSFNDYGAQGSLMHGFLSNVQQAPFHVACISHSLEVKGEDGVVMLVPQVGTRNFSDTVGKYFDHIVYSHIHNGVHKVGSSTLYRAGVLTGSRGDFVVEKLDPKKDNLLEEIFRTTVKGQFAEAKETTQQILQQAASNVAQEIKQEKIISVADEAPKHELIKATEETANTADTKHPLSLIERIKARNAALKGNV